MSFYSVACSLLAAFFVSGVWTLKFHQQQSHQFAVVKFPISDFNPKAGVNLLQGELAKSPSPQFCFSVPYTSSTADSDSTGQTVVEHAENVTLLDATHAEMNMFSAGSMAPGRYCCSGTPPAQESDLEQSSCWQTDALAPTASASSPTAAATGATAVVTAPTASASSPTAAATGATAAVTSFLQNENGFESTVLVVMDPKQRDLALKQVTQFVRTASSVRVVLDDTDYAAVKQELGDAANNCALRIIIRFTISVASSWWR